MQRKFLKIFGPAVVLGMGAVIILEPKGLAMIAMAIGPAIAILIWWSLGGHRSSHATRL